MKLLVIVAMLWPAVAYAKFVGLAKGKVFNTAYGGFSLPTMGLENWNSLPMCADSVLCASLLVSPATSGSISYQLSSSDGELQRTFSVELSRRDGSLHSYDVYRRLEADRVVLLDGWFSLLGHKAMLFYQELDGSRVTIDFSNLPPQDNEDWRLSVRTEVRTERDMLLLEVRDEMMHDGSSIVTN